MLICVMQDNQQVKATYPAIGKNKSDKSISDRVKKTIDWYENNEVKILATLRLSYSS